MLVSPPANHSCSMKINGGALNWDKCLCVLTVVKFNYGWTYETILYGHKICTSLLTSFILHFSFTKLSVTQMTILYFSARVSSAVRAELSFNERHN